ncbi:MAG: ORF6N domain-containing protein [Endomicrobium sp.]|jgi:hypothetical protein|nr:ORF6N domain-containing protein [Endomicrobium sp.]
MLAKSKKQRGRKNKIKQMKANFVKIKRNEHGSITGVDALVQFNKVKEKIITIRNQQVILDSDVAKLYGVGTKSIHEAVKNNPDKFPDGYILNLTDEEWEKSKISTSLSAGEKTNIYFSEKGIYILATILKSTIAMQTTIAIVETLYDGLEDEEDEEKSMARWEMFTWMTFIGLLIYFFIIVFYLIFKYMPEH